MLRSGSERRRLVSHRSVGLESSANLVLAPARMLPSLGILLGRTPSGRLNLSTDNTF